MKSTQKGFTLIELLVVIAIVAVLSVVVILTLNPAELLRQARDSNRISDLNTMKSAISLYLVDTANSLGLLGGSAANYANCYVSVPTGTAVLGAGSACVLVFEPDPTASSTVTAVNAPNINGTGWIPINFTAISSGAPIGNLPIDPVNATPTFYMYRASSTPSTFKLAARMESSKYGQNGSSDVVTNDGGNDPRYYEVGTDLKL